MAFITGELTETERFRAEGFIRAFIAEMPKFKMDGSTITYLELMDDTRPELRIMRHSIDCKAINPEHNIGSASVLDADGNDYVVFTSGCLIGCRLLSEAVERVRSILEGESAL